MKSNELFCKKKKNNNKSEIKIIFLDILLELL